EFEMVLEQIENRNDLRGVILQSGKPGMFIAGADLKEMGSAESDPAQTRKIVERGLSIIARIEALPYPAAAAIDGACLGGGLELALGFDYRLAGSHPKAEIGFPEVKIGLYPGWGGTQRLTRVIGPALAAELICAGEAVPAKKARDLGIVFDVVPSDRLRDECLRILDWSRQTEPVGCVAGPPTISVSQGPMGGTGNAPYERERKRKQEPVGLSEEQQSFTFAVARAQVLAKTKGQM